MLKFNIKGITEAKDYFGDVSRYIGYYATEGTNNAGYFLIDRIKSVSGNTKYSSNLEVITDYVMMTTWISPSKAYFEDIDKESKKTYQNRFFRCPYMRAMAKLDKLSPLLERIAESKTYETELETIVTQSLHEIKQIILRHIKGNITY